jgi:DNA (cytosine-5)-methyltransferase 1
MGGKANGRTPPGTPGPAYAGDDKAGRLAGAQRNYRTGIYRKSGGGDDAKKPWHSTLGKNKKTGMSNELTIVDMFCGAGGTGQGIKETLEELGMKARIFAINHWDIAVSTHAKNIPEAEHICESIEKVDPLVLIPKGKIDLLWASPECTHFSLARGKKPVSDQKRASPWRIVEWLEKMDVKRLIVENVREFANWGPVNSSGYPIKAKKGTIFRAFLHAIRSLGYTVNWQILNCANYGDPTTRRRFFLQAVKGRGKIAWPDPTHMEYADNIFGLPKWRSAREIIDWSLHGKSIFLRKRPLADATLRRIAHGITRFWQPYADPFLVLLQGTGRSRSLDKPLPTVTASGHHAMLIEPFLIHNYGQSLSGSIDNPLPTVVGSSPKIALIEPFILPNEGYYRGNQDSEKRNHSIDAPLPVIDTSNRYGIVKPFITAIGQSIDIRFRMLQPHELAAAQSLPGNYQFCGNKTEITKQIGNAVPVKTAKALSKAAIRELMAIRQPDCFL